MTDPEENGSSRSMWHILKQTAAPGAGIRCKGRRQLKEQAADPGADANFEVVDSVVLLILYILVPESAALFPYQYQDNTTVLFSHKLLSTHFCNRGNLDMSSTCPNPYELDLLIKSCGFECPPEEKPDCVNTQQGGSAYVCLPKNLTCEKGIRRIGWVDKEFQNLIVREEKCPAGTFQAYKSDCFQACTTVHAQLNSIPEKYIVFSEGDSMSPTYVYCNYLEGYFNTRNKTLLNYDQHGMHNPYFCQHVNFSNPCEKGKVVLGNGTCVLPCAPGMCRDDHDDFICKFNCSAGNSTNAIVTTILVNTEQTTGQTEEVENEGNEENNNNAVDKNVVIVATVAGIVCIIVLIGIIRLVKTKKGQVKLTSIKKYENGRTVIKAKRDVHYYARSKDSAEEMEQNVRGGSSNGTANFEIFELMTLKGPDGENTENEETAVKMLDDE